MKMNYRKGRYVRQVKFDWCTWTKMVWNLTVTAPIT